jgi:CopG family nickel-responsive transcriptional regulator
LVPDKVSDVAGGVTRFSVSVDPVLLEEFDETIREIGYNRSSAVQVAMRDFITAQKWSVKEEGVTTGAVTMIYDHHVKGLGETLTHIQHGYLDVVSSTTHIHLDHDNCLEILAVRGDVKRIKELTRSLMASRGVKQLKFSMLNI